jgi:hypothetical protein
VQQRLRQERRAAVKRVEQQAERLGCLLIRNVARMVGASGRLTSAVAGGMIQVLRCIADLRCRIGGEECRPWARSTESAKNHGDASAHAGAFLVTGLQAALRADPRSPNAANGSSARSGPAWGAAPTAPNS